MHTRRIVWPILIMLTVYFCSGQSQLAVPKFSFSIDKIGHFAVFAALATAWVRHPFCQGHPWRAWLLAALFGAADEWRQSFTPGRSVEFDDWIADALGAASAVLLYHYCPAWRRLLEWRVPISAKQSAAQ